MTTQQTTVQVEHGHLVSLNRETEGDELMVAAANGATFLVVEDAGDFDEDGGWLHVFSDTATRLRQYTTYDDDTSTIALASALTVAFPVGARVDVWDPDTAGPVVEYVALVTIDGQEGGDPLEATVDHQLADKLRQGIRTGAGESVELEFTGAGGLRVAKVYGKTPDIDGSYVTNPFMAAAKTNTEPWPDTTWQAVTDWRLMSVTDDITFDAASGYFTVSSAGLYSFNFGVSFAPDDAGSRGVRPSYILDGVGTNGRTVHIAASSDPGNISSAETSQTVEMMSGDRVRFEVYQDSGGPLNLLQFAYRTSVNLVRIAPS